jgi:DNA-binding response OmpR family regulator
VPLTNLGDGADIRFPASWRNRTRALALPGMDTPSDDRPIVVLVAEDEALIRMVAADALREEGFVAIEAGHAIAALDICTERADEVDVLFTDIRMPGPIDGLELARRVRERWPWILVVMASGNLSVPVHELPAGARFLPKPYQMRRVVELIREPRQRH